MLAVATHMAGRTTNRNDQRAVWLDRQAVLADFGRYALSSSDLDAILQEGCELVARGLNVPIAKVMEALPGGQDLLVRAVVGIPPSLAEAGKTKVPGGGESAAGYALTKQEPVICHVPTETRFEISELVRRSRVRTSANVIIRGKLEPFGALEVDSLEDRTFTQDDINFLKTYAHLLAAAVERQRSGALVEKFAKERETLLRELQHRIRNDLQVITALLSLEGRQAESIETRARLENVGARVNALRLVHDRLYATGKVGRVDLADYLKALCTDRFRLHGLAENGSVSLDLKLMPIEVEHDRAVAIGMVVNEFMTNSLKYAFPLGRGKIDVVLDAPEVNQARLVIADNGIGVPLHGRGEARGTGLRLIELFVQQLDATIEWSGPPGTRLTLSFAHEA